MTDPDPSPPLLRSLLFVPGNRGRMLDKALGLRPDAFVPDMEDSVPAAEKAAARTRVAGSLESLSATARRVIPRVNSLGSGLIDEDLAAVVGPHVWGVSVGKVGSAAEMLALDERLRRLEEAAGVAAGSTRVVAWLETAAGVAFAPQICRASGRLAAAAFGAEDLTNDMQMPRGAPGKEGPALMHARSAVALAARAGGVLALDTPFFGFRDPDGLAAGCARARACGYSGKFAIHPSQIETINGAFSPGEREVEQARREVAAFEAAELEGRGSTSLDGQVIDVPVVERARGLLRRHEAALAAEGG